MKLYLLAIATIGGGLQALIVWRGWKCAMLLRFPIFYSYMTYMLLGTTSEFLVFELYPTHYATFYWDVLLIGLVMEFGVLVEISDHMFSPYPAIRRLGRFLIGCVCAILSFCVVSVLMQPWSLSVTTLDLFKKVLITKAAIIILLLATAHYYRLHVGSNVAGLMLGFSVYLGINIVNFALAETFGRAVYGGTLAAVGPLSYTICLLIWTIKLWRYEPALAEAAPFTGAAREVSEPVIYRIDRLNQALMRVLRR